MNTQQTQDLLNELEIMEFDLDSHAVKPLKVLARLKTLIKLLQSPKFFTSKFEMTTSMASRAKIKLLKEQVLTLHLALDTKTDENNKLAARCSELNRKVEMGLMSSKRVISEENERLNGVIGRLQDQLRSRDIFASEMPASERKQLQLHIEQLQRFTTLIGQERDAARDRVNELSTKLATLKDKLRELVQSGWMTADSREKLLNILK